MLENGQNSPNDATPNLSDNLLASLIEDQSKIDSLRLELQAMKLRAEAAEASNKDLQDQLKQAEDRAYQAEERERLSKMETDEAKNKDTQTGFGTENKFFEFVKKEFNPEADDGNLAIVYGDVNNLKHVNDNFGHDSGDALIFSAAVFIKHFFRGDTYIHLHGDEFLIICSNHNNNPNFSEEFPKTVASRYQEKPPQSFPEVIDTLPTQVDPQSVNIAFGVAVYNKELDHGNLLNTRHRADLAMINTKQEMKKDPQESPLPNLADQASVSE